MDDLTTRQEEFVAAFRRLAALQNGVPPTIRQLQLELDIASPNGVLCHLKALRKKGVLVKGVKGSARTWTIKERAGEVPAVSTDGGKIRLRWESGKTFSMNAAAAEELIRSLHWAIDQLTGGTDGGQHDGTGKVDLPGVYATGAGPSESGEMAPGAGGPDEPIGISTAGRIDL